MKVVMFLLVLLAGCAKDVHAHYPSQPSDATGTLVLTMAEAASGVTVAVNGVLVVDNAHTRHVVIDGIPVGTGEVVMAANGADKAFHVWIGSDHPTTVPLGVPEESYGFLKSVAGSLITVIVYTLLHR